MGILGAILGDIIGSVYEFEPCPNPKTCELFSPDAFFTDDTVMTMATRTVIIFQGDLENPNFSAAYKMYAKTYPNRGYGGRFKQWMDSDSYEPYNSFGNGSAMRVSYIGQHYASATAVKHYAAKSAEVTHNHPEGIKGAVFTAEMTYRLKKGVSKKVFRTYANRYYPKSEYPILKTWNETCQGSIPLAVDCFLRSSDFESCMRNVLEYPCDTDTVAAICGTWAEEYYKDSMGEFIQKYDVVSKLQDILPAPFFKVLETEYPIWFK